MSNSYTIVLWCADTNRYVSMVAAHLMHHALSAANDGRADMPIPVSVGVANSSRFPIFAPRVSSTALVVARRPRVRTPERYDYLLTYLSERNVDASGGGRYVRQAPVLMFDTLLEVVECARPNELSKHVVLELFASAAVPASHDRSRPVRNFDLDDIAEVSQRRVLALNG